MDYGSQALCSDMIIMPDSSPHPPFFFALLNAVNLLLLFVLYIPVCYSYLFCYQRVSPVGLLSNTASECRQSCGRAQGFCSGNEQLCMS